MRSEDTFPIHANVEPSEISLGTVPASKYKRKVFNLVLNEHSGAVNTLDLTFVHGGVTSVMKLHIGAYDFIDVPVEQVASIEADGGTEIRAVAGATSIEILMVCQDL